MNPAVIYIPACFLKSQLSALKASSIHWRCFILRLCRTSCRFAFFHAGINAKRRFTNPIPPARRRQMWSRQREQAATLQPRHVSPLSARLQQTEKHSDPKVFLSTRLLVKHLRLLWTSGGCRRPAPPGEAQTSKYQHAELVFSCSLAHEE